MKITRKLLLGILAGLGIFIVAYSLFRMLTGIGFGEGVEKTMFDIIIFAALGIFVYNRKIASDEKKEREAEERAKAAKQAEDAETGENGTGENTVNREDAPS
jgi:uncharacterized membrane protein